VWRLQAGRPDFSVVHYATDTGVWGEYFAPGLHQALGVLWPLVLAAAIAGGLLALVQRRNRLLRWLGGVVLLVALLTVLVVTDRPDAVLRDPDRLFAWLIALLAVLVPAGLLLARRRGASSALVAGGFAALALATVAIAYPVQRDYLRDRYRNDDPETAIPGMHLDSAYRWARGVHGARIGLVGTTAGFLEYGFYGTDLSNRVRYLGATGPNGAFDAIPTCRGFRSAVDAAGLDYLVTSPSLNFIHPGDPISSPEAGWLRGEPAVRPVLRSGPVTIWRVRGRLDPAACGPRNAPLHRIPQQPPR